MMSPSPAGPRLQPNGPYSPLGDEASHNSGPAFSRDLESDSHPIRINSAEADSEDLGDTVVGIALDR